MARENVNFREEEDVIDDLRDEADERGFGSLSAYLRAIIRNRTEDETELERRLDEHEARIKVLESAIAELQEED